MKIIIMFFKQIINVGRCVGECRGGQLPARWFPLVPYTTLLYDNYLYPSNN